MLNDILANIGRFILLVFIQILVLNKLEFGGSLNAYFNPYLYILFILMLPVYTNRILLLIICFFTGLTIDIFSSTPGMHASACVTIGFMRPGFLNLIAPREGYETTLRLNIQGMGLNTFIFYVGICTLIHHMILFIIEAFNFLHFWDLLLRIITNSISTIVLILISQVLTKKNKEASV